MAITLANLSFMVVMPLFMPENGLSGPTTTH